MLIFIGFSLGTYQNNALRYYLGVLYGNTFLLVGLAVVSNVYAH